MSSGGRERKTSPEKCQDTEGDGYLGSGAESKNFSAIQQQKIEKRVGPLVRDVKSWRSSLLDQLREPGVVRVAGQIAGFDMALPETRDDDQHGTRCHGGQARAGESQGAKYGAVVLRSGGHDYSSAINSYIYR